MKSLGEPGEIHARETERDILADKFTFELRGRIKVIGRGKMQTW